MTEMRIGYGNDIHRLAEGLPLIIGGVHIESLVGAEGHSDADVLLHAVTDAILGALALGDIGTHFPNSDERWENASSIKFLEHAILLMREKGFVTVNVDSTVNLETPKLRPYINAMRKVIADALEIDIERVSVKAKTGESVDAVGQSVAVKAEAVVLLSKSQ